MSAHNVSNVHQVVIDDVCKVIRREAVALEQNRVRGNIFVLPSDVAEQMVVELCFSLKRHFKADNIRLSCLKICFYFFLCKVAAVAVVSRRHIVFCLDFADSLQTLAVAEAIVRLAVCDKLFCIFFVKRKTLALHIRTKISALVAAFVPFNAEPSHCVVKVLNIFFVVSCAVGVFKAQNELAAL